MVSYLAGAELRRRWRSVLLLTVLIAIVVGIVLASVAGARRSRSSFDRYLAQINPPEVLAFGDPDALARLDDLPFVEATPSLELAAVSPVGAGNEFFPMVVSAEGLIPGTYLRMPVLKGRLADPSEPLELVVGERTARRLGIDVGDSLEMESWANAEGMGSSEGDPEPDGPIFELELVGIVREPGDIGSRDTDITLTFLTPAFRERFDHEEIGDIGTGTFVALTDPDEITRLTSAAEDWGIELDTGLSGDAMRTQLAPTMGSIATALQVFAGVVAVAGLAAVLHVLGRTQAVPLLEDHTLSALGIGRAARRARLAVSGAVAAAIGTVAGVLMAIVASPLFPVGLARRAEPDPGIRVDLAVSLVGATVAVGVGLLAVAALGGLGVRSLNAAASASRRSRVSSAAADLGASPTTVVGLSLAVGTTRGARSTAGAAVGGAALGVLGVLAAVMVAASTDRLATTPALYGWGWDANIAGANTSHLDEGVVSLEEVVADDDLAAVAALTQQLSATVDGLPWPAMTTHDRKGHLSPVMVEGHEPLAADEAAVGRTTLDRLDKAVGDRVEISLGTGTNAFRVSGVTALPVTEDGGTSSVGIFLPGAAADALGFDGSCDGEESCFQNLAVKVADHADIGDIVARYEDAENEVAVDIPSPPAEVERLTAITNLPWFLAGFLALLAGVAVTYAAATGVRRRRGDLAILRVIGMTASQLRGVVAVQVLVLTLTGGVLGSTLGVLVGRQVWRFVVHGLALPFSPALPIAAIVLVPTATILVTQLAATFSRRAAGHTKPAIALRTE